MQLTQEIKELLTRIIKVARLMKIENVVIDQECIRGQVKEEGVMICHRANIPPLGFQGLGISRIDTLYARLNLLGSDFEIETVENSKGLIVKMLLSRGNTEVEFKCADPAIMPKAPRLIKDPIAFTFEMDEDTIALLSKAPSAVKGEALTFSGNRAGVIGKLSDIEGDMLQHVVSETLIYTSESSREEFYHSYKNKILIPLLKECASDGKATVNITDRGMINLIVLGITVYFAPEL